MKRNELRSRNMGYFLPQTNTHEQVSKPLFFTNIHETARHQRNYQQVESEERQSDFVYSKFYDNNNKHINKDFRRESAKEFSSLLQQETHQKANFGAKIPQYRTVDSQCSYGNMKSNFLKYQDSVAKDEYCQLGQPKEGSSAIYDSMQFLSMKREKSMNKNNDSGSYLKKDKSNPTLKYHAYDPSRGINLNIAKGNSHKRANMGREDGTELSGGRINNYFSNQTFIVKSKNQPRQGALNEDLSMQNLLCDSFDEKQPDSPDSVNSMYDQRSKKIEQIADRQ
ncbi:unnamed protein product [Moneuplotes crassus]|uniref:Uncharacterized protein n=1 Tax=Euplotes crassus TaxID=5936 RepID=A0AAD1UP09_EUPCR|nr:unnamed protein product [Moneuplotes crassus]